MKLSGLLFVRIGWLLLAGMSQGSAVESHVLGEDAPTEISLVPGEVFPVSPG
ncbi:MAG: hypothetical protein ACI9EF_000777 [Pseudohongiellaceae bacterium]